MVAEGGEVVGGDLAEVHGEKCFGERKVAWPRERKRGEREENGGMKPKQGGNARRSPQIRSDRYGRHPMLGDLVDPAEKAYGRLPFTSSARMVQRLRFSLWDPPFLNARDPAFESRFGPFFFGFNSRASPSCFSREGTDR